MVKIALQIKATLENVTNLRTGGDDFWWCLKVRCGNCMEVADRNQFLCLSESSPVKGGRGSANLVIKCRLCGRNNNMDIVRDSLAPYDAADEGKFKTVAVFDCRGLEPLDFFPMEGFTADGSESGARFSDVTFAEGDWTDYDEEARVSVGIYDVQHQFVKL